MRTTGGLTKTTESLIKSIMMRISDNEERLVKQEKIVAKLRSICEGPAAYVERRIE